MNFLHINGFDPKEGKTRELQQWLSANEEKLALECPKGVEYVGTYFAVHSSEKGAGTVRSLWRMDSYAAQDAFSQTMKEGGTFARLMDEMSAFVDERNDAHWSDVVLRKATDAAVWGE